MEEHWTENEELLAAYVLGCIEPKQRLAMDHHLTTCDNCRMRVDQESEIAAGVRQFAARRTKDELRSAIGRPERELPWPHILSMAAAIFLIIGIGFHNRWFVTAPETQQQVAGRQEEAGRDPESRLDNGEEVLDRSTIASQGAGVHDSGDEMAADDRDAPQPAAVQLTEAEEPSQRLYELTGVLVNGKPKEGAMEKQRALADSDGNVAAMAKRESPRGNQRSQRAGNLLVVIREVESPDPALRSDEIRCTLEQVDTLFHLTVFLPVGRPDPASAMHVILATPDSIVLRLGQTTVELSIPTDFRGRISIPQ